MTNNTNKYIINNRYLRWLHVKLSAIVVTVVRRLDLLAQLKAQGPEEKW